MRRSGHSPELRYKELKQHEIIDGVSRGAIKRGNQIWPPGPDEIKQQEIGINEQFAPPVTLDPPNQKVQIHPPLRIFIDTTRPLSRSILNTLNFWRGTRKNSGKPALLPRCSSKLSVTSQYFRSDDNSTSSKLALEAGRDLNRVWKYSQATSTARLASRASFAPMGVDLSAGVGMS